jgi:hypothetical protein
MEIPPIATRPFRGTISRSTIEPHLPAARLCQ